MIDSFILRDSKTIACERNKTLCSADKNNRSLKKHLPGWYTGVGWSMFPTLLPGDNVRISKAPDGYKIGQVVAFFVNDRLLIHRIVSQDPLKDAWCVKGDTCIHFDPWLTSTHIVGYVSIVRRGRRVVEIGCDSIKARISMRLAQAAAKFLQTWPRQLTRFLYLFSFLSAIIALKCVRMARLIRSGFKTSFQV